MSAAQPLRDLVIVGASGHGRVALDIALECGWRLSGFVDSGLEVGARVNGVTIVAAEPERCEQLRSGSTDWFVAIGENRIRRDLLRRLRELTGRDAVNLVHPTAVISRRVDLGNGLFVGPRAVINTDSRLDDGVILNTAATVDHDGRLAACCQISPGCHLAGNVTVEALAFLGTGVDVIPGRKIGSEAIVGAGSVVVADIAPGVVAYGNPARERRIVSAP